MWPTLTIGVVFTETQVYYRYTPQKLHTFLPLFIYPPTVGKFPWFEIFSADFGWKPPVFPWFAWLEIFFKFIPDFPDRWEPC